MPQKNASLESCRVVKGSGDAFAGLTREQRTEPGASSRSTPRRLPTDTRAQRAAAQGGNESGTTEV